MADRVNIIVSVPDGNYCAMFGEFGLINRCPLLQKCHRDDDSFYCPIANSDTHCGQDSLGVLKQRDYYDSICPSLYREKIMELLRQKARNSS